MLAEHLHMTVTQMRKEMDQWEWVHWRALAAIRKRYKK